MTKLAVYIIESPSPADFLADRHEGATLRSALRHAEIEAELFTVVNHTIVFDAFILVAEFAKTASSNGVVPVVHLSMHGDADCVAYTSNETMAWRDLGDVLAVLNGAVGGNLLVSLSTCNGFTGVKMAHRDESPPFLALVGPTEEIAWRDTVAAFSAYYHHLEVTEGQLTNATNVMNAVIARERPPLFQMATGWAVKAEYDRLRAYVDDVAQRLEDSPPGTQAGMRRLISTLSANPHSKLGGLS